MSDTGQAGDDVAVRITGKIEVEGSLDRRESAIDQTVNLLMKGLLAAGMIDLGMSGTLSTGEFQIDGVVSAFPTQDRLASNLRAARKAFGMTQQQLGDLLGIGREAVNRLERGQRTLLASELITLSLALSTPLQRLAFEDLRFSPAIVESES